MNETKRNLPIFRERENIVRSVNDNMVTIIIGDTGCGKSMEAHCLHAATSIIHNQSERACGEGDVLRGDGRREAVLPH